MNWYHLAWQYSTFIILKVGFTVFARMRVYGRHYLKLAREPVIFFVNHRSMTDPFVLIGALPISVFHRMAPMRFTTKVYFMKKWYLRPFLLLWGCVPVAAKTGTLEEVLKPTLEVLKDKKNTLVFFPEGKVITNENESKARPGTAFIAKTSGRLFIPVSITGTARSAPHKFFTFQRKYSVRFGQPFYYHEAVDEHDDLIEASEKIYTKVRTLIHHTPEGAHKSDPLNKKY